MKHLILGGGNLGLDLKSVLDNAGEGVHLLTRSGGFTYPEQKLDMDLNYDVIWHAVGAGSVAQAKENYQPFEDLHVKLVREIAEKKHDHTKFIWFSTDYLCNENNPSFNHLTISKPQSLYAESKLLAEQELLERRFPNTYAVRVGSLYGRHKPSFPDRLRHNLSTKQVTTTTLPRNLISPTPTHWIAKMVWSHFDKLTNSRYPVQHCGPMGSMMVSDWGELVLGGGYTVRMGDFDPERPAVSYLDCSFTLNRDDIHYLWKTYGY